MCGRYIFYDEANPVMEQWITIAKKNLDEKTFTSLSLFEVFPTQNVMCAIYDPKTEQFGMKIANWGIPMKEKRIINARSETANTALFFQDTLRCVLPATGYFEWSKNKEKYYYTIAKPPMYLAGFIKEIHGVYYVVILTEEAGAPQNMIHNRQPVIFNYEDAHAWCKNEAYTSLIGKSIPKRIQERV